MSTRYGYESTANGRRVVVLDFWMTIARGTGNNIRPSVKVTAGYPSLARNERAINLKMELPVALFEAPAITANITIEEPMQSVTIDASAVAEAVRQAIGLDVDVQVVAPVPDGE